ncbi:hypothetical protein [Paenibacillus hamazuiensis]|uniref:hypothetical protein n=1 Tax=Paenibacillus hamazuiensis TaxID=2936508 RepID=UPI0020101095|nr:hypothetical protein [Paenibacillus hamazuiensis]
MTKWTKTDQEHFREHICGACPGSLWGEKSICRIHQISIGQVEDCPEWKPRSGARKAVVREAEEDYGSSSGQAFERAIQVDEEVKDYSWMVREMVRLREELEQIDTGLTSKYGIDAAQPKGKGTYSSVVLREVQKRDKCWKRLLALEEKVKRIDAAAEQVKDGRYRTVLECMLDGQRMNAIARHIGVSRQRLYEIRRDLMVQLASYMYGEEVSRDRTG